MKGEKYENYETFLIHCFKVINGILGNCLICSNFYTFLF